MAVRHGGKILIDQLEIQGVRHVFEVPGESFLAALDGLYQHPVIKTIVGRHEGAVAMMAEATGRLTGRPGIAFVTRGPGATNATSGVYVAHMDATPMILFVGLPPMRLEQQWPFQDLDLEALFKPITKWTAVIHDTRRIPEYVARAYHVVMADRPGPVVLGLPEDVLAAHADTDDARYVAPALTAPTDAAMDEIARRLAAAERPVLMVGGPGWSSAAKSAVEAFAERHDLPVAASFRCQDYVDNRHPCYVGHLGFGTDPALRAGLRAADLVLAVGSELGEIAAAGSSLIGPPAPGQQLIHVHPSGAWSGGTARADLPVAASATGFAAALEGLDLAGTGIRPWADYRRDLRRAYERSLRPRSGPGEVRFDEVVQTVSRLLPDDAITTNGAGNYSQWVHRYFEFKTYRSGLAPICGSMGYGLPAAIAAKLAHPSRPVVAFAGDGCFSMAAMELATAVQYELPIVVIVATNGIYGTIRMHQERRYPGRVSGTSMTNPDFAALARSFGADGVAITRTDEFEPAFRHALASDASVPTVIELHLGPEQITPIETLEEVRTGGREKVRSDVDRP